MESLHLIPFEYDFFFSSNITKRFHANVSRFDRGRVLKCDAGHGNVCNATSKHEGKLRSDGELRIGNLFAYG